MTVGESFQMAGGVYILGIAIALGMAALIKLINFIIKKTDKEGGGDI
jgi:hypothetical protein